MTPFNIAEGISKKNKKPELLAPAGDLTRLKVAIAYGADAVYIGGKTLSMRAKAKNFRPAEMEEGILYAHSRGKKVYVAANICAHNDDFKNLTDYLKFLESVNADAVLISDPGVFMLAKEIIPETKLHISTQANVTNYASAEFWRNLGAARVVLARELSLGEILEISEKVLDIEIETFVHGAMCMAYSGRCLISNYLNARDANCGECSQPCRFVYTPSELSLTEEKSGESLSLLEDERGTFIFNSKDLNMISHIPDLIKAGIGSFKIEGRMKTEYYTGAVTKAYRMAIDDYFTDPALYAEKIPYYRNELKKVGSRGYTTGFFFGKMTACDHDYSGENQITSQDFLAIVEGSDKETGFCNIEQRNKFQKGDRVEILKARGENYVHTITEMHDENGAEINSAPHPKQKIKLKIDGERYDMLRKVAPIETPRTCSK
ncbi:MAG: U32 family peptidase [Defluviitaleaceae bacterium]|nr:U32 family peptidase [Defluviitaleaceae bacterium]